MNNTTDNYNTYGGPLDSSTMIGLVVTCCSILLIGACYLSIKYYKDKSNQIHPTNNQNNQNNNMTNIITVQTQT